MRAPFAKAHVAGNTYVVLLEPVGYRLTPERVRRICLPGRGVEAHGIVAAAEARPFGVRVYNGDGSRAETSGNGLRIYGWWIVTCGLADKRFSLRSMGRGYPISVRALKPAAVGVGLGRPHVAPLADGWWRTFPDLIEAWYVRVGNPHCCFETAGTVEDFPLPELAALVERQGLPPGGANVEAFARASISALRVRVWERGVGETPSSGSGGTAAAVAASHRGPAVHRLQVFMPGGSMEVQRTPDGHVWSWGTVEEICRGELVLP